jgi:hypothetical protein
MNKRLIIIIPIVVIAVIVILFFTPNTKSQNNSQLSVSTNVPVVNNTSISAPVAPKKITISLSESVDMSSTG